jgi:hypothetical protein
LELEENPDVPVNVTEVQGFKGKFFFTFSQKIFAAIQFQQLYENHTRKDTTMKVETFSLIQEARNEIPKWQMKTICLL